MYSDSHVHTVFSGDCEEPVTNQIETAIALGMKEICITDHHDFDVDSGSVDFSLDTDAYLHSLRELREHYRGRIDLRIGVEFGQQPHLLDYEKEYFSAYEFDFVIGSTHFVGGLDPYYPGYFEGRSLAEANGAYFAAVCDNVRQHHHYDTAAHLDYVVRYGPNQNHSYEYRTYQDYLDEILKILIHRGKSLECNTGGLRKGTGQLNPGLEILKRYRELGGELLTLGSDAHRSGELGYGFDQTGALLKQLGFTYYTTYKNRKPQFHRL